MDIVITSERPDAPEAAALVAELDALLIPLYPIESHHGYAVEKLIREGVHFFITRVDDTPAGCGGVQFYADYAELKRMFVRPQYQGLGLGRRMLEHLEAYSRAHGHTLLRLETGIHQTAAIALYERAGFTRIPPFGPYTDDPVSLCYEKRLNV